MPENEEYKNFNEYEKEESDTAAEPEAPVEEQSEVEQPVAEEVKAEECVEEKKETVTEVKSENAAPEKKGNGDTSSPMGIVSIALALMGCCGYGLSAIVAIVLGAIALKRDKKDVTAKIGLIAGILVVLFWIATIVRLILNPELLQEILDEANNLYGGSGNGAGEVLMCIFGK